MSEKQPTPIPRPVGADQADDAVVYLEEHGEANANVNLAALRRKIDRRLMPYMFCCYVLQFLDKVMLNVSLSHRTKPPLLHVLTLHAFSIVCCRHGIEEGSQIDRQ